MTKNLVNNDQTALDAIDKGLRDKRINPALFLKLMEKREQLLASGAPVPVPYSKPQPSTPKAVLEAILGDRSVQTMTLEEGHELEERFGLEMAVHTTAMRIEEERRLARLVDKAARQTQPQQPQVATNPTVKAPGQSHEEVRDYLGQHLMEYDQNKPAPVAKTEDWQGADFS
jgi:hypothetical protein